MLLALGIGSLFNHCSRPNLDYRVDQLNLRILYYATRKIEQGEELCIFYGNDLWFTDPAKRKSSLDLSDDEERFLGGFDTAAF